MSGYYRMTAAQGKVTLNPRLVTRVVQDEREKNGSATGEREYCVKAYIVGSRDYDPVFVLDPGWGSKENAERVLVDAGQLITESS